MAEDTRMAPAAEPYDDDEGLSLLDLAIVLAEHWKLLVVGPLLAGLVALGITYLIKPTFTARTVFLPPQQQQSLAASALASLGALSGLVGAAANIKSPADQYVALMQSATVSDRIIDRFGLMKVYDDKYRFEARKDLAKNVQITIGKKDGLITVDVDDHSPQRAADIANRYVDELRDMTHHLALTEAQQRRLFFEEQLKHTRDRLTQAQQALQASGFNPGALKAEPKAAADTYARLQAEVTAAQVRLQTMRRNLADSAPEVQQQLAQLDALRAQLGKVEATTPSDGGP
ncbi:MAG: lipopolysaccharide biosynthesis protein, partial [Burkholderiales bacterium]|nr:lipopolysaccharide biosynthesis protein [Burkholderiales bacterium]